MSTYHHLMFILFWNVCMSWHNVQWPLRCHNIGCHKGFQFGILSGVWWKTSVLCKTTIKIKNLFLSGDTLNSVYLRRCWIRLKTMYLCMLYVLHTNLHTALAVSIQDKKILDRTSADRYQSNKDKPPSLCIALWDFSVYCKKQHTWYFIFLLFSTNGIKSLRPTMNWSN